MAKRHHLSNSDLIGEIPLACSNELAAAEFLEKQRWGNTPGCVKCGSVEVYKMADAKTGERNRRYLWRCRDCKEQYTVRIGTVYEESRIELRHWCYAFWRACTSKKGVSALEISRHCQISYKSALFLMNRIRFAMAPALDAPKLTGTVELDEVYVGPRKPRYKGVSGPGRSTLKTPVFCAVERGGQLRRRVVADVTAAPLRDAICEEVDSRARLMTDEYSAYRCLWQFDFLWNNRQLNDGERTILAVKAAEGKRLMYKDPVAEREYIKTREQKEDGEQ